MNGPVLDPDKEESTMEALGMIETRGLVALIEASDAMVKAGASSWLVLSRLAAACVLPWFAVMLQPVKRRPMPVPQRHSVLASWYPYTLSRVRTVTWKKSSRSA